MSYDAPQSRNEAILQNILGANNVLVDPQSRIEAILQAILYDEAYDEEAMSRMEELLLAIKNNGTWDHEPISRNEEILYAKLTGGTYDKEPQSRIEALLIDWLNASPVTYVTDIAPYLFRISGGDNNAYVGTEETDSLVGASAVVNQLIDITLTSQTVSGITITVNGGAITLQGTAEADISVFITALGALPITQYHKYVIMGGYNSSIYLSNNYASVMNCSVPIRVGQSNQTAANSRYKLNIASGTAIPSPITLYPCLIDLTAMFGTTIADYIYSLEQATAGSGIAYLRKYGFFTKDYIPYTANTLQSVKTSAHIMRDAQNAIIGNYALPNIDLRGLYKLDASNNLYADGDSLTGDGTLTHNFIERAYESGDENLPDAITDGTTTVVKLATPTTEQVTGFTNPQTVSKDGTEEYTDERDFPLPVGHETKYPSR